MNSMAVVVYTPTESFATMLATFLSSMFLSAAIAAVIMISRDTSEPSELDNLKAHYSAGIVQMMKQHATDMAKIEQKINAELEYTSSKLEKKINAYADSELSAELNEVNNELEQVLKNTDMKNTDMKNTISYLEHEIDHTREYAKREIDKVNTMLLEALKLMYELDHKYSTKMAKMEVQIDAQQEELDSTEEQLVDQMVGYNAENQLKFENIAKTNAHYAEELEKFEKHLILVWGLDYSHLSSGN
jgi:hypothetical protein